MNRHSIDNTQKALDLIDKLGEHGWSFGFWMTIPISSILQQPTAAFVQGVHPPKLGDPRNVYGYGETFADAVLNAAEQLVK